MVPKEGKKSVFNFLNEGQNDPFNKLLGAPAILLGAPSISRTILQLQLDCEWIVRLSWVSI